MRRSAVGTITATFAATILIACGGSESGEFEPPATPAASDFPAVDGRTLDALDESLPDSDLVALPTQLVFDRGLNRYAFGVFTLARELVNDAQVALYFASAKGGPASGPFPADVETLETPMAFRSMTSAGESGAPEVAYIVPEVNLDRAGEWRILAVFKDGEDLSATRISSIVVDKFPAIPSTGDRVSKVHTRTAEDVGGDLEQIDTRNPPDQMHRDDFADVVGKRPVVIPFATPAFCESRVCGPVVDIAEQIREEYEGEVVFIHQEVFNENDPTKGVRRELKAFNLATEPWLFVIDRNGRVTKRFEGAFSAGELRKAVEKVVE